MTYIIAYLVTGFAVMEFARVIPYVDWFIEFVGNPVLCGFLAVIAPALLAPSHRAAASLYGLAVVTLAVTIPDSAQFLFAQSGLVAPVIATVVGGLAAAAVAITGRTG